jgi:hypothetical protein
LTKVTFNFTVPSDSYLHLSALQNASDLVCDFGPAFPETPVTFVLPPPLFEDFMTAQTNGTPSPSILKGMRYPGIATWICHSPDEGFTPGIDLHVDLRFKGGDKILPGLSKDHAHVKVQPSADAARMIPSMVMEGETAIAEIDLYGSAEGLTPVCRFEDCPLVDVGPTIQNSSDALLLPGGRISCQLPVVQGLRAGLDGSSQCNVRVSLNGGFHWSDPPLPVTILAKPTLFDAYPLKVMTDVFCFRCAVVNIIGSHMVHSINMQTAVHPKCMLGTWAGKVLTVQRNVSTCTFHTEAGSANSLQASEAVAGAVAKTYVPWSPPQGFVRVSLAEALSMPPTFGHIPDAVPGGIVEVEIVDSPFIGAVSPSIIYHVKEQLLYLQGSSLPNDPHTTCILTSPTRERFLSSGTVSNSSLVVCQLPDIIPENVYVVSLRFESVGVLARPAEIEPTVEILVAPSITRFEPLVSSAITSVPIILEGLPVHDI